jgi:type I restriction enzyme S subunit
MAEMKTAPEIRFKGFREEWQENKLGDFGTVAMNRRIFKEETTESGEIPFYKIGTFGGEPDAFISRELFEEYKTKYSYPKVGDILISAAGSIGRTVEYTGKDEYFQDSNIVWLSHDERLDNSFLKYFYSMVKWIGLEGSTIKRLYNKNILETKINLPFIAEQQRIGKFFSFIDNLITYHQREHDKTVNIKKAMLEKMFPKHGEDKPEIRFAGFSDAWKKQEFTMLFDSLPNNTLSRADLNYECGEVKNIHYGDVLIKFGEVTNCQTDEIPFITNAKVSEFAHLFLRDGDVLFADTAEDETVGKTTEIAKCGTSFIVAGLHTMAFRPRVKMAPNFLGYFLNSPLYHRQLLPLMQGIKVLSISRSNLAKTTILYPVSEKEQYQIGSFFASLDNLITFHQRELAKLQNLKKALLQKMFI